MDLRWLAVLGCLSAVFTISYAGVTPQTLIITKPNTVENEKSTSTPSEPTTEVPLPPIKILEMHVRAEVALRYSRTSVTTLVKNPAKRSQETTFRVLLPETAFISGFIMTLEGKEYAAYVKEKEEAKQIYNDAVAQSLGAAHVATKARDSNHFTVTANVEANSTASFHLTYEELLIRYNDVYKVAINLLPQSLVPDLSVIVHIKELQKITTLRVPEISTGNEIIPTENYVENQKVEITRSPDGQEVTVVFKPDLEEQKRLREVYAEKAKESLHNTHSFGYNSLDGEDVDEATLGQFVVQYDVGRNENANEVLVNDGYFVHFFAPSDLPPLKKYVVFVLDLSGSMIGRKIEQLREAMQIILGELHEGDFFSLVLFESSVKVQDINENGWQRPPYYIYGQMEEPPALLPPYPATKENIAKAKQFVSKLVADGGTNIAGALDIAIALTQRGILNNTITAALASNTTSSDTVEKTNVSDNSKPEPIIIFLTDGEPTVGETDPKRIINSVTEKNAGDRKASIYSLGFGDYADFSFLRKVSLRNRGFSRHIYEAADAALQLRDFYKQISSPLIANVKFSYPKEQVEQESLTKIKFGTFYAGSEVVVAGRLADNSVPNIFPTVHGYCGVREGLDRIPYKTNPVVVVIPTKEKRQEDFTLERLWAYLTIKQLLDERDAAEELDRPKENKTAPEKKALELALKYSFVTELTSLVVVKPNATNAVNAESVDKEFSAPQAFGSFTGPPGAPSFSGGPGLSGPQFAPAGPAGPVAPAGPVGPARPALAFSGFLASLSFPALPSPPGGANDLTIAPQSGLSGGSSGFIPTTPAYLSLPVYTTQSLNPLEIYGMEEYAWIEPLINSNSDELVMQVNGTALHLKLIKDTDEPQKWDNVPCSYATDGATGSCVYLTRCEAARNITVDIYTSTYCLLDRYAGVCCPQDKISP